MRRRIWIGRCSKKSACSATSKRGAARCCRSSLPASRNWIANSKNAEYRQLKQRIALRCHLRPVQCAPKHRSTSRRACARAGMDEQTVFPPDVLAEIHRRTQGIPRLINSVCDNLLLTSFAMESKVANVDMLEEVSRDLHLEWPGGNRIWSGVENTAMQEPRL